MLRLLVFRSVAKHSRYTEATKLAQSDMQKVIDSFGEDTPFMSDAVSDRTQARRDKLANAPADIRGLLDKGFPQYFVERLAEGD